MARGNLYGIPGYTGARDYGTGGVAPAQGIGNAGTTAAAGAINPIFGVIAAGMQDPDIWNATKNVIGGGLRRAGRAGGYLAEGATNNIAQPMLNRLGDWGNQYLPQSVSGAGRWARNGLYGLGQSVVGAQGNQGIWDAINGRNMPQQQMGGMPGQQGGMAAMQGLGGNQMNPEEAMQQAYMQQVQQPYNFDYTNMENNLLHQYNTQLQPQLATSFAGNNNLDSSAFLRAQGNLTNDLVRNLGALREQGQYNQGQLNQNRIQNMGQYIGNQQQLGLGARRLGLDQSIAQRDNAYRMLGLMGNYGQAQQSANVQQLIAALNAQGGLANIGMGQPYQPTHVGAGQSIGGQIMAGMGPMLNDAARAAGRFGAAYGSGGMSEVYNQFKGG